MTSQRYKATVLSKFEDYCRRVTGGEGREASVRMPVQTIAVLTEFFGLPLGRPTLADLERVLTKRAKVILSHGPNVKTKLVRGKVTNNTYNAAIQSLRKWCQFHDIDVQGREYRGLFKHRPRQSRRVRTRDDLLTPEDIDSLIRIHKTPVWKALSAVLWDTGARPSELTGLEYSDVERDGYGFTLHIKDSKSQTRSLRLITPVGRQYFQTYYTAHTGSGALFIDTRGNRIRNGHIESVYRNASKHLGKALYATLFRKSASTFWKQKHLLDDTAIRRRLGHAPWSKTFERHYLQYFDDDYQEAELRAMGVKPDAESPVRTKCWNCGILVDEGVAYCPNCNQPQDEKAMTQGAATVEKLQDEITMRDSYIDTMRFDMDQMKRQMQDLSSALGGVLGEGKRKRKGTKV